MSSAESFLLPERTATAIGDLVRAVAVPYDALPAPVRARVPVVLTDLLGVTAAGMRTPELQALVAAWPLPPGPHPLPGTGHRTTPETAALLAATAACSQELDEGNKHAAGHPAAHVVFAAIAAAQQSPHPIDGRRFLGAVAGGYEVAARFGRAVRRDPAWHPHGHWGVTGAAYAAATLLGATPAQVAAAVDAATGLMTVAPWDTVLAGDPTRNLWMGQANLAGLSAAHLARAGLVENRGGAAAALALVGELDPDLLVKDLGTRWLAAEGYLKQHAACSFTHAAIDLVLSLRAAGRWTPDDVASIRVGIHSLAAPLLGRSPHSRLSAMFSLPFAVATAAVNGAVTPATMEPGTPAFDAADAFSERVTVEILDELDAHLPGRRVCEVTVSLVDGTTLALAQPDPIGDTAHFPLDDAVLVAKLDRLLDAPGTGDRLLAALRRLPDEPDVVAALAAVVE
ncbi:MmgE/PrpD family protein [Nocardioides sp. W7]|uniref:MmgE/PrpD family protein n=1 Tax=Nocardioides sp. W7 TaxID=2931390 RepID=UPI001FD18F59|nr:MmgE/PrpD family protein [Nocardioides sp. W7]